MNKDKIFLEYERILKIPESKPEKQIMVCPVGVVGAGKTTVMNPLSKELSLLRISSDEIRQILKKYNYDYSRVAEIVFSLAEKYIKNGYSIAIDKDCASKESQEYIKAIKKQYGIKIFWIHINPPKEFIINKLKNYKHTWLFKDSEQAIENYRTSKSKHKNLNLPFVYTFDTSKDNLNNQIQEAISIIKQGVVKVDCLLSIL